MTTQANEYQRLEGEIDALRRQLAEANEALDAIRRGDVDAVVVERPEGPQIYTLTGADEPYRVMVEEMQEGAVTLSDEGVILYCNKQIARMLSTSHRGLLGRSFSDFLPPASLPVFDALLRDSGQESSRGEVILSAGDGRQVPALLAFRVLSADEVSLISLVIADLTEQKRQQEIAAAEAFSRSILDQAADAVVVCDETGRIIRANQAAHRLCGGNPLFQPFAAAFPLRRAIEPTLDGSAGGQPEEVLSLFPWTSPASVHRGVEAVLPFSEGRELDLLLSVGPLLDAGGETLGCIITMTDITQRKLMENALRESEERFRLASKATDDAIWDLDLTTGVVRWNDVYATAFDRPPQTAGSRQWWIDHIHPEDRDRTVVSFRAALDSRETVWTCEYRFRRADGSWSDIYDRAYIARDTAGQARRMVGAMLDLTDRKRAEEALKQAHIEAIAQKNRLEAVLESLPVGVAILDAQGGQISTNRTFHEVWGCGAPAAHCVNDYASYQAWWADTGRPVQPHEWASAQAVQKGTIVAGQLMEIQGFDDVRRFVINSAAPVLDADGRIAGSAVAIQDVTELKKTQQQLQEAREAAEAANQAKSRFLANISHELRTPMNAILGMILLALRKQADPVVADCLQTARGSADLLLVLLNDLLDSAKIEAGKLELEAAPFSLRRVLDQTTQVLAVRASEKGIVFSCRLAADVPDALVGDQVRLRQVLLNLAGNGIKFTERGEVVVTVGVESQGAGEACLQFTVRDTGIGIAPADLERIFQPFSQGDASTTRAFGGTGLGLTISASLVRVMGGRIWLESQPGQGSTFYFTVPLPLAKELPREEHPPGLPSPAASPLRILLAEDNPANQKLATYVLQERGHVVDVAGDGQQAVQMAQQTDYDVILMDVQMPGMGGLEATAVIRSRQSGGSRVPIIAMTAHAMTGDRERFLAAGMDGYLSKPVDFAEMVRLVESSAGKSAVPG